MKTIKTFLQSIYKFFYHLTPTGKEEKYWNEVKKKSNEILFKKGAEELELNILKKKTKTNCINYAKKTNSKKRFSNYQLGSLIQNKFKKELKEAKLIINLRTLKFIDA